MTEPLVLTPGRRWALVLGLPFVLGSIGLGGIDYVTVVGRDSYQIHANVAPVANKVAIGVGNGDITVVPTTGKRAVLSGRVNYSLTRPVVKWEHTSTGVSLVGPNCFWIGDCGVELAVAVPAADAVHATSGSGNVNASKLAGALNLNAGSGDIQLAYVSGPLVLGAGSGDISGTFMSDAKVQAQDGSGDVNLSFDRPPGQVDVNDGSGNITVSVPGNVSYSIVVKAYSGSTDIGVPTNPLSHNVIHLTDDSGDVSVVPSGH